MGLADISGLPVSPELSILLFLGLIFGLVIGSFLNVVIYRLPLQMQSVWRRESLDFLGMEPEHNAPRVNLVFPSSRCPKCHAPVKPWQNIPVVSYIFLRGKCAHCQEPISVQYPLVELACGLMTAWVLYRYGINSTAGLMLLYSWVLLSLTGIDIIH